MNIEIKAYSYVTIVDKEDNDKRTGVTFEIQEEKVIIWLYEQGVNHIEISKEDFLRICEIITKMS